MIFCSILKFIPKRRDITGARFQSKIVVLKKKEAKLDLIKWNLQDYLHEKEWKELLEKEFRRSYFIQMQNFLKEEYEKGIVRPPKEMIFNAFNLTKFSQIKVVILGQDPYHDNGQANGLAFSVPKTMPMPPSLRNIMLELKRDVPEFERELTWGGCLEPWARQGVFLLNTTLTVEVHKPSSHSKIGWSLFTDRIIKLISAKHSNCVFMLWGSHAHKKQSLINQKKHLILTASHPSPYSAKGFFGSKCFSQANAYLQMHGKTPINWSLI